MDGFFDPTDLTVLQRIVDLAVADLGIIDEREKSVIAARVVAAAGHGEWDFDRLMAHAKGNISHVVAASSTLEVVRAERVRPTTSEVYRPLR